MNGASWAAYRSAGEVPDYDYEPPEVRVLWSRTHVARRPHLCTLCGDEIEAGVRYRSEGVLVEGVFEAVKHRLGAGEYPSGCPRFSRRDEADLQRQFEADRAWFAP